MPAQTYARIDGGLVVELLITSQDIATLFNPALLWVVATAGVAVGWSYAGGVFSPPPTLSLADKQARVWTAIKGRRDWLVSSGGFQVTVGTAAKWFHSDPLSLTQHMGNKDTARDQLAVAGALATDALKDPVSLTQIQWKCMDGTFVGLTCQLALDIAKAAKGQSSAMYTKAEQHRQGMLAAADPLAYDYSTGWPAVYPGVA